MAAAHLAVDELNPLVDLASYWEYESDQWHRYGVPGHHLLLVVSGRLRAVTQWGRASAGAGEMLCFRPSPLNQYGNSGPTRFFQLHLSFAREPRHQQTPVLDGIGLLPLEVHLGTAAARTQELFAHICHCIEDRSSAQQLRVRAALFEILAVIAETAAGRPPSTGTEIDRWQDSRRRLESHLDEDLPIAQVARDLHLSADHFSRRFRRRFGVSPKLCRTQARLRLAAQRLRAGQGPVKSVAHAVGISDATAFTRLFRRHYGMAPSALLHGAELPVAARLADVRSTLPVNRHLLAPQMPTGWEARFHPHG